MTLHPWASAIGASRASDLLVGDRAVCSVRQGLGAAGYGAFVQGPRDSGDLNAADEVVRVNLGALLIPADSGVDVQVQADQVAGTVSQVNLVIADAAVQVQPYAAPRSGGLWSQIRQELVKSIEDSGGQVQQVQGSFGDELLAQVPSEQGRQSVRFAGVDGPRWFLRLVFLGKACQPGPAATRLETVVRSLVVDRGDAAMPPRAPLPMTLPVEATTALESEPRTLTLPKRGPEITEIR